MTTRHLSHTDFWPLGQSTTFPPHTVLPFECRSSSTESKPLATALTGVRPSHDPSQIRSIAVHTDDVVTAFEAARDGRPAVLRVTPPFDGRMCARIHVAEHPDDTAAIHVDPAALLDDGAPPYPLPADTEDELRAADREYSHDALRDRHVERVGEWRETVRGHLVDRVALDTPEGTHEVDVKTLG